MKKNPRSKHPLILTLKLSDYDRERLELHAHILRERAQGHPSEAHALLQVARCFDEMLQEDRREQSYIAEAAPV